MLWHRSVHGWQGKDVCSVCTTLCRRPMKLLDLLSEISTEQLRAQARDYHPTYLHPSIVNSFSSTFTILKILFYLWPLYQCPMKSLDLLSKISTQKLRAQVRAYHPTFLHPSIVNIFPKLLQFWKSFLYLWPCNYIQIIVRRHVLDTWGGHSTCCFFCFFTVSAMVYELSSKRCQLLIFALKS